ncbi:ester cyclase [Hymenobacter sp. RP-2-7]|uniref:Ester cyclase n=1 Tax=Hymenobacter polaris TaxID=2682546 RepID=A0A7Y0ABR1_9BACT|nr:ester cyclase [Hymenobacter polaris]NML64402.1 ester cyclase [Hymenobacter polaris]
MDRIEENTEHIQRFFDEIWSAGNMETVDELCDPQFQFILAFAHLDGREAFKNLVRNNRRIFENLTYKTTPDDIVTTDLKGAAFWNMSTTKHSDTWRNVPASNNPVAIKGMTFFRFNEDGKFTEARVQNDVISMMKQINGIKMLYDS